MRYPFKSIVISAFFAACAPAFAQEVKVELEKKEYKFDEIIKITYQIDAKIDSVERIMPADFKIVDGGSMQNSSMSTVNGKTTYSHTYTYSLRPLKTGELTLECPQFYSGKKTIKGKTVKVKIIDEHLSEEELLAIKLKQFKEDSNKPKGTLRYIIKDNMGYIELYDETSWVFYRYLTKEEIQKIKEVK